jgi:predicted enzyme related to lactoylglutathione lyase
MERVIHFEIQADKPERAVEFYEKVFDWKFEKLEGSGEYWLMTTGPEDHPGVNGGLIRTSGLPKGTINAIDVPYVDEFNKTVIENRGQVVTPKTTIPDLGYYAYCEDTEGNVFGIFENDPSAK